MQIPSIATKRLLLRPWTPADGEAWFRILQQQDILRYFPNPKPPERSKADAYINHHLAHWNEHGYGHWAIVLPEEGSVLGWCGLEYLSELGEVEVAYLLSRKVWGRGYATEAAKAAVAFGLEKVNLGEIIGLVHPDNRASIGVLEKCGLTFADRIVLWRMEMSRYRISRPAADLGHQAAASGGQPR